MINSICRRSAVVMLTLCALALAACGGAGGRGFANCTADAASASPNLHIDGCTLVIDSGRRQGCAVDPACASYEGAI
jgi:hypothetical protein